MSWYSNNGIQGDEQFLTEDDFSSGPKTTFRDMGNAVMDDDVNSVYGNVDLDMQGEFETQYAAAAKQLGRDPADLGLSNPFGDSQAAAWFTGGTTRSTSHNNTLDDFARSTYDSKRSEWEASRKKIVDTDPSLDAVLPTYDSVLAGVQKTRQEQAETREKAAKNADTLTWAAGSLAGGFYAGLADPVNIVTAPLGGTWSAGLLRWAAKEAVVGVGIGAVQDIGAQQQQAELYGQAPDIDWERVGMSALASGAAQVALGGVFNVGAETLGRAVNWATVKVNPNATPEVKAALAVEERALIGDIATPTGAVAPEVHATRLNEADAALQTAAGVPQPKAKPMSPQMEADVPMVRELVDQADFMPQEFAARIKEVLGVRRGNLPRTLGQEVAEMVAKARTLTAAVRGTNVHTGKVEMVRGAAPDLKHSDVFMQAAEQSKSWEKFKSLDAEEEAGNMGFMDEKGKWYSREEAFDYLGLDKDLQLKEIADGRLGSVGLRYIHGDRMSDGSWAPPDLAEQLPRMAAGLRKKGYSDADIEAAFQLNSDELGAADIFAEGKAPADMKNMKELYNLIKRMGAQVPEKLSPEQIAALLRGRLANVEGARGLVPQPKSYEEVQLKQIEVVEAKAAAASAAAAKAVPDQPMKVGDEVEAPEPDPVIKKVYEDVLAEEEARINANDSITKEMEQTMQIVEAQTQLLERLKGRFGVEAAPKEQIKAVKAALKQYKDKLATLKAQLAPERTIFVPNERGSDTEITLSELKKAKADEAKEIKALEKCMTGGTIG